jgi:uncharacterized protein (TIGR02246 family)
MRKQLNVRTLAPVVCGILLSGSGAALAASDAAIDRVEAAQASCWNRHDANAYAALFTPDADVVNVLGWHWKGRAQLAERLSSAFAGVFRDSILKIENVESRLLRPDIAVAHVQWSMTGARSPDGRPEDIPQHGIQTQVLVRSADGSWQIAAFQNTNSIPERSFPSAPGR